MGAVTRYMDGLLSSGFRPIFGNVVTATEDNSSQPINGNLSQPVNTGTITTDVDWLAQYVNAKNVLDEAKKNYDASYGQLVNYYKPYNHTEEKINYAMQHFHPDLVDALNKAQSEFDRLNNEKNENSNTSTTSTVTLTTQNSPVTSWGSQAQAAEQGLINRATSMLNTAKGAESARVANMGTHPLLGGGLQV